MTERKRPKEAGALAVERRRTAFSAAKRERQALLRRAASVRRRAVHSGAALRVERLGSCGRLFRGPAGVLELPPGSALFRKVSRMQNLRFDLLFRKPAACGVKRPRHVGAMEVAAVARIGMKVR